MTPADNSAEARRLCRLAPVIPVITITDAALAAPLARALVAGGLPVLEVTLRTDAALPAIRDMAGVAGAIVGAGTILAAPDVAAAKQAGARFAVSPGATERLCDAVEAAALPFLPGAASASEAMRLMERGFTTLKFFPAEAAGGVPAIRAIGAPLPQITFCPTGGISPANVADYLALPNVACVGGSWVCPPDLIAARDWGAITALARSAAALPRS